ncbi:MAG: hypothetical protein JOY60_17810 [Burkholderiaceae bacterium]|nr:hypothetical protein [Burkholderiaceae bacterium]
MQSIIQILKVNEVKSGVKDGRAWELQDCECLLLNEKGEADSVGVLPVPKALRGSVTPGVFLGSFGLRPNLSTRRIEAVLVGLQPYQVKSTPVAVPRA